MSELISNLNTIDAIKSSIKSAIEAKGVSMSGVSFPDYPSAIGSITTTFVTETLSTSGNGTFTPGQGVDGFSQVVVDVPQSVSGWTNKQYIEGTIDLGSVIYEQSVSYVYNGVFQRRSEIITVSLPQCTLINDNAFNECSNLTTVSLPVCQSIYNYAFRKCTNLEYVYLPVCTNISQQVFYGAKISFIDLPSCRFVGSATFCDCKLLTSISLPVCEILYSYAFDGCLALTSIVLPVCSIIGGFTFRNTNALSTITLGYSGVVSANYLHLKRTESIYVPASLVDTYKSAQYWSGFSSRIFPIPE